MKIVVFCLLVTSTSIFATCRKLDCSQTVFAFEGYFRAYPDQDSIRIGDTIWLESTIPTRLTNKITGQVVNYTDAVNFGPSIQFLELIMGNNDPAPVPSANQFDLLLISGTTISSNKPDLVRGFRYLEENGTYKFKLGIIPKKKGLFTFSPGNSANVFTRSDECSKADFNLAFQDTDQHIYLYEQSRPGYSPSSYERTHMYVFKVY